LEKQYAHGKLDQVPSRKRKAELKARVRKLERLLGKVTLEIEFLKKPSDQELLARMDQICLGYPICGYRQVSRQLQRAGWLSITRKWLGSCVRKLGLQAAQAQKD
jgi:hypothetical protein